MKQILNKIKNKIKKFIKSKNFRLKVKLIIINIKIICYKIMNKIFKKSIIKVFFRAIAKK